MNLLAEPPDPTTPERARRELDRTVDRLRSLPIARLSTPLAAGGTRAGLALTAAQSLADRTAALAGDPRRALPEDLPPHAAADVLAVCAQDLLDVIAEPPDPRALGALTEALIVLRAQI